MDRMNKDFAAKVERALANAPPHVPGVLIVRLAAIRANYRRLSQAASPAATAAVLKADGYGLGHTPVFWVLREEGCHTFFAATLSEAAALRALDPNAVIYALDGLFPGSAALASEANVRPVLGNPGEISEWAAFCKCQGRRLPAAIHIDTGMTRLGLTPAETQEFAASIVGLRASFEPSLVISHLACADDPENSKNEEQRVSFEQLTAMLGGIPRSLANSAGIFLGPAFHFDLVRPGIALYGSSRFSKRKFDAEPVVWLYGRIAQVRWAEPGDTVGYGAMQTLTQPTRIATVCVGYADGFFRSLSATNGREGSPGYIGDHRLPLLGRISMDLATFDATDVPEDLLQRGGFVELIGEHVSVDDVAACAGTIGYEVLTSLGRRYHRVYLDD
ncbi:MAG: alanine racemase [Rhodomicrobium sp.]